MASPADEKREAAGGSETEPKRRRRRKRRSGNFTDRTLNWFRLGEEMGEMPIEGEYEDPPPRFDVRELPRVVVSHPRTAGAALLGLFVLVWLLS